MIPPVSVTVSDLPLATPHAILTILSVLPLDQRFSRHHSTWSDCFEDRYAVALVTGLGSYLTPFFTIDSMWKVSHKQADDDFGRESDSRRSRCSIIDVPSDRQ